MSRLLQRQTIVSPRLSASLAASLCLSLSLSVCLSLSLYLARRCSHNVKTAVR